MKKTNATKSAKKELRNKLEQGIVTKMGMTQRALAGKLVKEDHLAIAKAARSASQLLRKSDPDKASALYYVYYKHTHLQGIKLDIPRLSRKAAPVKKVVKARKVKAPATPAPAVPEPAVA